MTQLRCKLAPEILLIRLNSTSSTSPNLLKSTFGHGNKPKPAPFATPFPAACAVAPLSYALTAVFT